MMNFMLILSCLFNIQGREPNFVISFKKSEENKNKTTTTPKQPFDVGVYSDIYGPISFKLGMMKGRTKIYIIIPV